MSRPVDRKLKTRLCVDVEIHNLLAQIVVHLLCLTSKGSTHSSSTPYFSRNLGFFFKSYKETGEEQAEGSRQAGEGIGVGSLAIMRDGWEIHNQSSLIIGYDEDVTWDRWEIHNQQQAGTVLATTEKMPQGVGRHGKEGVEAVEEGADSTMMTVHE